MASRAFVESRRVAVMMDMERPLKEYLVGTAHQNRLIDAGECKKMQGQAGPDASNVVPVSHLRRTHLAHRGFLCSTPENIQHWYTPAPLTAETVKGIFEHQHRPFYEPKPKGGCMLDQRGFNIQ
jgi:hypothetical protein